MPFAVMQNPCGVSRRGQAISWQTTTLPADKEIHKLSLAARRAFAQCERRLPTSGDQALQGGEFCYTWPRPWHVGHGTGIWPLPRHGAHMFETGPLA